MHQLIGFDQFVLRQPALCHVVDDSQQIHRLVLIVPDNEPLRRHVAVALVRRLQQVFKIVYRLAALQQFLVALLDDVRGRRRKDLPHRLSDHLVARDAQKVLAGAVDQDIPAVATGLPDDDRRRNVLDDRIKKRARAAQLFLSPPSLRDVVDDAQQITRLAVVTMDNGALGADELDAVLGVMNRPFVIGLLFAARFQFAVARIENVRRVLVEQVVSVPPDDLAARAAKEFLTFAIDENVVVVRQDVFLAMTAGTLSMTVCRNSRVRRSSSSTILRAVTSIAATIRHRDRKMPASGYGPTLRSSRGPP